RRWSTTTRPGPCRAGRWPSSSASSTSGPRSGRPVRRGGPNASGLPAAQAIDGTTAGQPVPGTTEVRAVRHLPTTLVALAAAVLLSAPVPGIVDAHGGGNGLVPLSSDGHLVVTGEDFGPDETLAIAVESPAGRRRQFAVTADGQGHVRLVTDLAVRPGDD